MGKGKGAGAGEADVRSTLLLLLIYSAILATVWFGLYSLLLSRGVVF